MLEVLQKIDEAVLLWVHQGWRTPWGDRFFPWITESEHFVIPLAVAWVGLLVFGGRYGRVLALILALTLLATDQISSQVIKPWVGRIRPCFAVEGVTALLPQVRSASFPSSHATNIFGAATVFIMGGRPRWVWAPALVIASLVALSRVYVGVHYPSDILAGSLLGVVLGAVVFMIVTHWLGLEPAAGGGRRAGTGDRSGAPKGGTRGSRRIGVRRLATALVAVAGIGVAAFGFGGCGSDSGDQAAEPGAGGPGPGGTGAWAGAGAGAIEPGAAAGAGELAPGEASGNFSALPEMHVTVADTVRRGDTLSAMLLRNGLYLRDIEAVLQEVRQGELFSLRRLKPGERIELTCDLDGYFEELRYERSPDEVYVVGRDADCLHSYRTGLPYASYLRKVTGTLATTVDEMLRRAGAGPDVTYELTRIFDSDIDFLTEPRVGDRLTLLIEEKRYEGERVATGDIYFARYEGKRVSQTGVRFVAEALEDAAGRYFTPEGESLVRAFLRSPLNYRRISSRFSRSRLHPILRVYRPHLGVDYAAATGTPVVALGDGVVAFAGWNGGFGRQVRVRHGSMYLTCYGHLSRFGEDIRTGRRVTKGQTIGYVGSTGLSTGPHLDFRVQCNGAYIDPLKMENPPTAPVSEEAWDYFRTTLTTLEAVVDTLAPGGRVRLDQVLQRSAPTAWRRVAAEQTRDS